MSDVDAPPPVGSASPTPPPAGSASPTPPPVASPRRRRRWPRILAAVASVLVLLVATAGGAFAVLYHRLEGNITSVDISNQLFGSSSAAPSAKPVVDDAGNYSAVNILLMGSDTRQGDQNKGYGQANVITGARSDTTILLHLSADRTHATAVSIPRDTWVTLPECVDANGKTVGGYDAKFNTAFELAGPGCTVKLVQQLSGLTIDHFMVVDFGGFKNMIDAMGGVEVCLTKPVDDQKSHLKLPAGTSTVMGDQALAFVRARKTLGDGSDLSRIKRQQAFLSSLIRKASSTELLLNPVALYNVLNAATESLTADPGLANLDSLKDLALSVKSMKPSQISFVTVPWQPKGDGANVVIDEQKSAPLWAALEADQAYPPKKGAASPSPTSTQPPLKTPPEKIYVQVLNGSGTVGMAKKAAADLRAQGYNVVGVGNADTSDYASSVVLYDPNRDESAKTLTYAVTGATSQEQAGLGRTLTLVVGRDYTGVNPVTIGGSASPSATTPPAESTTADQVSCAS